MAPMQRHARCSTKDRRESSKRTYTLAKDECNRPDTTLEGLPELQPYFDPPAGKGIVTAGNCVAALRRRSATSC